MPKYNVHIYTIVRVKVCGVEAESPVEAIEEARKKPHYYDLFDYIPNLKQYGVREAGWGAKHDGYLVDEEGDEEYENSKYYKDIGGNPVEEVVPTYDELIEADGTQAP